MDRIPSMEIDPNAAKATFLKSAVVPLVSQIIERQPDDDEKRALGFVVDKSWIGQVNADDFMSSVFRITPEDSASEAALKIHNGIFDANMAELNGRKPEATGEELKKLDAIGRLIAGSHTDILASYQAQREVYLGSVPELWLPDWVKNEQMI